MITKSEAMAVNVLLRACGIRTGEQTVEVSDDAVVLAIHLLAKSAHKAIGAGVSTRLVEEWRSHDGIVPAASVFDALEDFQSLDPSVWYDQAGAFSCNEADVVHQLLQAVNRESAAAEFMAIHVERDAEDDPHILDQVKEHVVPQLAEHLAKQQSCD